MDVREKLVEIIQNSVGGCARHWAEVIADGLITNGVTVQEWIPVTERLPENGEEVLTHRKRGMNVENRFNKDWCFDEFCDCPVTHWMPLPQPPKGE